MQFTWKLRALAFVWFGLMGYLAGFLGMMLPNAFVSGPVSPTQPVLLIGACVGAIVGFCFSPKLLSVSEDHSYRYGRVALLGLLGGLLSFVLVLMIVALILFTVGGGNWIQFSGGRSLKTFMFLVSTGFSIGGWSACIMGALSAILFYLVVDKSQQ